MFNLNLFSKDMVNTNRQSSIDLCKSVCIMMMVLCHVFYIIKYTVTPELNASYLAQNIVRLLGAQFFMFSMGLGLAYSKKSDAKSCVKRGFQLLFSGYLLNFLREILPWMLIGKYPLFSSIISNDKFIMLLSGDILQFAGLAFFFFALVKALKLSDLKVFVIAVLFTALGAFISNDVSIKLSDDNFYFSFIGLIVPIKNFTEQAYICFSFSNWIIYPVIGWLFGKMIKYCKDLDKFYLYLLCISVPILLVAWAAFDAMDKNFLMILINPLVYHLQNPIILAVYMNIIAIAISVGHLISKPLTNLKIWNVIKHLGNELPTLYIVSWVIIGWIGAYLKFSHKVLHSSFETVFITFVIVFALSELYIFGLRKTKKDKC